MEVECKLRIDAGEVPALRERLAAQDATLHGQSVQVDTYFHHPSRDLVAGDEALRVRHDGAFEITYKGPRSSSDLKMREELNLPVGADPRPLMEKLGFEPAARLEKRRERWGLGGCDVCLDHIDGLGWFVEIEADEVLMDPQAAIHAVRRALELEAREALVQSYLGMALAQDAPGVKRL